MNQEDVATQKEGKGATSDRIESEIKMSRRGRRVMFKKECLNLEGNGMASTTTKFKILYVIIYCYYYYVCSLIDNCDSQKELG